MDYHLNRHCQGHCNHIH